jgi:chemotaxis protein histidine kinase CheA
MTKTDHPAAPQAPHEKHESPASEGGGDDAQPVAKEAPSSKAASLQQSLAVIGEELEKHEQASAAGFRRLQQRLAALSRQMEQAETQTTARLAELELARARAQAEIAAAQAEVATAQAEAAAAKAKAAASSKIADDAAADKMDGRPDSPATSAASSGKIVEAPVALAPPPAASPGQTPAHAPLATLPAAVAARPVLQAVAAPRAAISPASAGADRGAWERAALGTTLTSLPGIASDRAELVEGVLSGEDSAIGLVGQLMIFNSASAERMPQLLKDVGEAFYAWRPHAGGDSFRTALIDYLADRCASAGVTNTIELVRPGDRYDHTKHNAKQRGVEVDEVFGWIVLRDNGKVYTKASVSVK